MAAISSAASGPWSSASTWAGGVVPTSADTVTIAKNHTVTLDTLSAVALSVVLNVGTTGADVGGRLVASTVTSSKIIVQRGITSNGATGGGGTYASYVNLDVSAVPGVTCELRLNASNTTGTGFGLALSGNFNLRGAPRKRWTRIAADLVANSSKSCVVADASGWRVGDQLAFASTSAYNASPRTDLVTIDTLTAGAGTSATVTWSDGAGTGGAVLYAHAAGCPVGNFTSNLIVGPHTDGNVAYTGLLTGAGSAPGFSDSVTNVLFRHVLGSSTFGLGAVVAVNAGVPRLASLSENAFFECRSQALFYRSVSAVSVRDWNVFYSSYTSFILGGQDVSASNTIGPDRYCAVIRASGSTGTSVSPTFAYQHIIGWTISGVTSAGVTGPVVSLNVVVEMVDCEVFASNSGVRPNGARVINCKFGTAAFPGASNVADVAIGGGYPGTFVDCQFPTAIAFIGIPTSGFPAVRATIVNRNGDAAVQEVFGASSGTVPIIRRDASMASRSNASMQFTLNSADAVSESFQVLAKSGETVTMKVLVRKSASPAYGAASLPSVTVSGLGIAPVSVAMSPGTAADQWETLTLSATNSGASDGLLTVTLAAQSATAGAKAWFAGIPYAPFVTRARHYGFVFNETSPTVLVNPVTQADEATAAAYTGVTIDTFTPQISVGAGTANTFQKVYDHIQAWAVQNIDKPVLLTSTDGNNFAVPLTCKVVWPSMGTDGTLAGGWLQLAAPGTHTYKLSGTKIEFQAAGAYNMSGTQFGGTVELVNTSGGAVTVSVPSGTSYTNTGPGITVTAPTTNQSVTVNGLEPGSRIQIYDLSSDTELYNGVVAGSSHTWSDPSTPVAPRTIRLRAAWASGTVAKQFVDTGIGTCGTGVGDAAVTYLINQQADAIYGANAVDGSTVTGITIVDAVNRMQINIGGGTVSWMSIYAYNVHWLTTEEGIRDDGSIITAKDVANYTLALFKIKNTSATPLQITGGYGVDSVTGSVADILDVTGGSIFPVVDHVVSSVVSVGGANIITGDIADIPAAVLAAAVTTPIHANIQKVNDVIVNGTGATGDEWGP